MTLCKSYKTKPRYEEEDQFAARG